MINLNLEELLTVYVGDTEFPACGRRGTTDFLLLRRGSKPIKYETYKICAYSRKPTNFMTTSFDFVQNRSTLTGKH